MKTLGFDKQLYILPFDHRGSFQKKMFGWEGELSPQQTAEIAAAKRVIYDAFQAAVHAGVPKEKAGILVDEQFGAAILRDAVAGGYTTACPAEKSGQDEFDFECGDNFGKHIEAFRPTFCKVLVRYNPEGDQSLNRRQLARLKRLSNYLHSNESRSRFMFELLVPAEKAQLDRLKGDKKAYDLALRPQLMVQAIQQLQDGEVEPDVWKIEGLDRREDCSKIVAAVRRGARAWRQRLHARVGRKLQGQRRRGTGARAQRVSDAAPKRRSDRRGVPRRKRQPAMAALVDYARRTARDPSTPLADSLR